MLGFKEIFEETALKLTDKDIKLSKKELEDTVFNYFRTVSFIMQVGKRDKEASFIKNIVLHKFGVIRLKFTYFSKKLAVNRKQNTITEVYPLIKRIKARGWVYYYWSEKDGHVFIRSDGLTYRLKCSSVGTKADAYREFEKVMDNPLIEEGLSFTCLDDLKKVEVTTGKVAVYNRGNELVKVYDNLYEASKVSIFSTSYIHSVLLYNTSGVKYPKRIRGFYYFFDNEPKHWRNFGVTNVNEKHRVRVDLLDIDTKKVIIRDIGTVSDVVEYLNSFDRMSLAQTSAVRKALRLDRPAYGYRYRKSTL